MTTKVKASVLENTAVTAGTYGSSNTHSTFTVDAQGRLTYGANVTPSIANTQITGTITDAQIAAVANTKITGVITAGQIVSTYSEFASNTALLFQQTAAPTGWTKVTTHNDKALRVVSGTASSGGVVAFSTANTTSSGSISVGVSAGTLGVSAGTLAVGIGTLSGGAVTLTTAQIPSHNHTATHQTDWTVTGSGTNSVGGATGAQTGLTGGGGSHTHVLSGSPSLSGTPTLTGAPSITSATFTGNATNFSLQYVDVIIATKN